MAEVIKQTKTDQITKYFPDDLIIDIFLKLPVISLFLFRSVSKHWLSLIQNPNFIKLHNNRSIDDNCYDCHEPMLIVRIVESELKSKTRNIVLTLLSDYETLPYKNDVALELLSPSMAERGLVLEEGKLHLMGPCNGLFCLTDTVDVVVFNPAIRECRNVPSSPLSPRIDTSTDVIEYFNYVSFGFDRVSNDYKVLRIQNQYEFDHSAADDDSEYDVFINHYYSVEIFSLNTSSWKELDTVLAPFNINIIHSHSFFFNGAFHWLGGEDVYAEDICAILVFDLNNEAFDRFNLPTDYCYSDFHNINLSDLNESLALVLHWKFYLNDENVEIEIWVMKEYGIDTYWSKLCNIEYDLGIERPLAFGNKGEFLIENDRGRLGSYDLETRAIKEFEVHGVKGSMYAFRYKESLVSVK